MRINRDKSSGYAKTLMIVGLAAAGFFSVSYFGIPRTATINYNDSGASPIFNTGNSQDSQSGTDEKHEEIFVATHIETPEAVKALYMTSWVAGTADFRNKLVKLIDETEINSVVIDIKDYSGKVAFEVHDPLIKEIGSQEIRIPDIRQFIKMLHEKGVYVIGRVSVFQDPHLVGKRSDLAVKRESDGEIWKDYKGISWLDAGSKEVWEYMVALGKESYSNGFDELNFDYVRFPSDGNMNDIYYPFSEEKVLADPDYGKAEVIRDFFAYLSEGLKGSGVVLSVDLFGMVTTNPDDLNVGQVLEYAEPYFDYIAPMVYPSHYPRGFNGWQNPNHYPHEIVKFSMDSAVKRLIAASSTPDKLRPWLQDFDYGGNYGVAEVRAQIQAVYDAGLTSWMIWSPSNIYTTEALLKK
jgi:hypothetical protein